MTAPIIDPLPEPPSRGNAPDIFVARADAFIGALPAFADQTNALGAYFVLQVQTVEDLVASAGYSGTSSSAVTIGTGSKSLTTQPNLSYLPGVFVAVSDSTAPKVNQMIGVVTAYNANTGAMTFDAIKAFGAGDISAWSISLSGPPGAAGSDAAVTKANIEAAVGGAVALVSDQIVTISGTTHTFAEADNGKVHRFTSSTAVTATIPNSLSEGWNALWSVIGTGQVTFAAGPGTTRRNASAHSKSRVQYSEGSLRIDTNAGGSAAVAFLSGDTAA